MRPWLILINDFSHNLFTGHYRNWDSTEMAVIKTRCLNVKHALLGSLKLIGSGVVVAWAL